MVDHPPTLINIITREPIDKLDKVKDKIQDDILTGSMFYLLVMYMVLI